MPCYACFSFEIFRWAILFSSSFASAITIRHFDYAIIIFSRRRHSISLIAAFIFRDFLRCHVFAFRCAISPIIHCHFSFSFSRHIDIFILISFATIYYDFQLSAAAAFASHYFDAAMMMPLIADIFQMPLFFAISRHCCHAVYIYYAFITPFIFDYFHWLLSLPLLILPDTPLPGWHFSLDYVAEDQFSLAFHSCFASQFSLLLLI